MILRLPLRLLGRIWDARAWRPDRARLLWSQVAHRGRNRDAGFTEDDHLRAAAEWLAVGQDAMTDGGVGGRYRLDGGWTSSYPETTGYIIPTFLALSRHFGDPTFKLRAKRCADFLLSLQLPDGAFPGREVHENTTLPSVFNTAQILCGLVAWHQTSGDRRMLEAARRAADWIISVQDPDGAWRRHVYGDLATTYSAYASCWLAEFGVHTDTQRYVAAAARHLEWVLQHYDKTTGWFDLAGFSLEAHRARQAVLHTVAYTLWGVLRTSELLEHRTGIAAVETAALAAARADRMGTGCRGSPLARLRALRVSNRQCADGAGVATSVSHRRQPRSSQRGVEGTRPCQTRATDAIPRPQHPRRHSRIRPDVGRIPLQCAAELGREVLH